MAALILLILTLGVYMARIEQNLIVQYRLIQFHKSLGAAIFALALLRIAWRVGQPGHPPLPVSIPAWQRRAARCSHLALYVLMLAIPLSGWLMASASPLNDVDAVPFRIPNTVFGLFDLPDPFPEGSEQLETVFRRAHGALALGMALLVALHVAAALKHHLVDGDSVLRRMWRGGA